MISVIIPMYNSANTIERALQSIVTQDYDGLVEIIVVNDGSKDNSVQIVEKFIEFNKEVTIKLILQENGGVSKARNTGLKNAKGDFVAFLDSDDAWFTNKLSNQMKILRDNVNIDLLGAAFEGFYFTKNREGDLFNVKFKNLIFKNYFQPSTVILKKNVIDKIGLFDESQKYAEEGNFFFRVSQEFNCFFYNKKLIVYGDGKQGFGVSGLSANLKEMEKGELKNLKFAYKNNWINLFTYAYAVSFSILKYIRRIIIVSLKKMKQYNLLQIVYLIYCKLRGMFVFANARLVRFPIDLRGKKYMKVSKGFTTGIGCRLEAYPINGKKTLFFGDNFQMNDYVHITAMENVTIGNNVLLASKIYISDCSHGSYLGTENDSRPDIAPLDRPLFSKPVIIEDNVWLGEFVSVLPGVTIGKGTIVGANSVVSRSLPAYVIAVGIPAKPIKKFNFDTNRWEIVKN